VYDALPIGIKIIAACYYPKDPSYVLSLIRYRFPPTIDLYKSDTEKDDGYRDHCCEKNFALSIF